MARVTRRGTTPERSGFSELVFSDLVAARPSASPSWLAVIARLPFQIALQAALLLRIQQVFHRRGWSRLAQLVQSLGVHLVGAEFVPGVEVGPGVRLVHPHGLVLGCGAKVGTNVMFASGVVLAARRWDLEGDEGQAYPTLEDGVFIGAHAVIVGGVTIGRGAVVGANSVVTSDVPAGTIYAGAPAKQIGVLDSVDEAAAAASIGQER